MYICIDIEIHISVYLSTYHSIYSNLYVNMYCIYIYIYIYIYTPPSALTSWLLSSEVQPHALSLYIWVSIYLSIHQFLSIWIYVYYHYMILYIDLMVYTSHSACIAPPFFFSTASCYIDVYTYICIYVCMY